jgi:hypothetical protein
MNRPTTYKKLTYAQKLSRVNRKLRTGDITTVANTTGYSTTHVSDVLQGNYFNDKILNEAFDMTRGRIANPVRLQKLGA